MCGNFAKIQVSASRLCLLLWVNEQASTRARTHKSTRILMLEWQAKMQISQFVSSWFHSYEQQQQQQKKRGKNKNREWWWWHTKRNVLTAFVCSSSHQMSHLLAIEYYYRTATINSNCSNPWMCLCECMKFRSHWAATIATTLIHETRSLANFLFYFHIKR